MRTRLSPRLQIVASHVAKSKTLRKLLTPMYDAYKARIFNERNRIFKKNGSRIFCEFDQILTSNNLHYSVFAGTLLGAIRERGFIKHDMDIDIVMFARDYSPMHKDLFASHGFRRIHYYEIDNGAKGREETYEKDGVSIDIFYIYSDEKFPTYQCDFHELPGSTSHQHSMQLFGHVATRRIEFPVAYDTIRMPFEDFEVSVIANYDEWLRARYGNDYMIPDPTFHDNGTNPHISEWEEVYAIFKED